MQGSSIYSTSQARVQIDEFVPYLAQNQARKQVRLVFRLSTAMFVFGGSPQTSDGDFKSSLLEGVRTT